MQGLAGKVAVITGGASGVGLATARALARERVSVVLADIEQTALDAAVASLRDAGADATGIRTDVGDTLHRDTRQPIVTASMRFLNPVIVLLF